MFFLLQIYVVIILRVFLSPLKSVTHTYAYFHCFIICVKLLSPNYPEFFHLIYGRFLVIWPKYAPCHPTPWSRTNIRLCKRYIPVLKLFFFSLIFFLTLFKVQFLFQNVTEIPSKGIWIKQS